MDWGGNPPTFPSTAPAILNFKHYRNTTWTNAIEFKYTSDDTSIDISNYNFTLTVKRNAFDTKAVKILSVGKGLLVAGADSNFLMINTLLDFQSGSYVYDLLGTTDTDEIIPFLKGKIKLEENV